LLKEQYQQTVVVATAAKEEAATAAAQAAQAREAAARERERVSRETEARPAETAKPAAAPIPAPAPAPVAEPEPESTEALQSDVLDHVAAMRAKKLAAGAGGLLHTQADADLRATVAALRQVGLPRPSPVYLGTDRMLPPLSGLPDEGLFICRLRKPP
jgi:hypothetical protein